MIQRFVRSDLNFPHPSLKGSRNKYFHVGTLPLARTGSGTNFLLQPSAIKERSTGRARTPDFGNYLFPVAIRLLYAGSLSHLIRTPSSIIVIMAGYCFSHTEFKNAATCAARLLH